MVLRSIVLPKLKVLLYARPQYLHKERSRIFYSAAFKRKYIFYQIDICDVFKRISSMPGHPPQPKTKESSVRLWQFKHAAPYDGKYLAL